MEQLSMTVQALMGSDRMLFSERLRVTLAQEIATGALASGAVLDEQAIADRYGVSRTPVREALRQLAALEMIELRPRRGAVVTSMRPQRVAALFEMTAEIEATCARLATYRTSIGERIALQRVHREAAVAAKAGDHAAYVALNEEFHDLIYNATHNEILAEQAISLRSRLAELRRAQLGDEGRLEQSWAEHEAVLNAMAQGDGVAAERHMRAHLFNAASAFRALMAEGLPPAP